MTGECINPFASETPVGVSYDQWHMPETGIKQLGLFLNTALLPEMSSVVSAENDYGIVPESQTFNVVD